MLDNDANTLWFGENDPSQRMCSFKTVSTPLGAHICSPGLYQDQITNDGLLNRLPNLRHPDWKVPETRQRHKDTPGWSPSHHLQARAACVDLEDPGNVKATQIAAGDAAAFQNLIQHPHPSSRRLFIVESIDPDFVDVLGRYLKCNPMLFVRHQRTALWEFGHRKGNMPDLASNRCPLNSFLMEYSELRQFSQKDEGRATKSPFSNISARSPLDYRHIGITKVGGKIQPVGIIHRKATFWSQQCATGGWDGMSPCILGYASAKYKRKALLIVDPPLPTKPAPANTSGYESCDILLVGNSKKCVETELYGEPYQGGYLDFISIDNLHDIGHASSGPTRKSMFDDLCFYWEYYAEQAGVGADPICATYFLQKIVASQYTLLVEYLRGLLSETELLMADKSPGHLEPAAVAAQWADMQSWSTRCSEYNDFVDAIVDRRRGFTKKLNKSPYRLHWQECTQDFEYIQARLRKIKHRCDLLVSSLNAMAGMVGNRQSLLEAQRVKVLTFLATVFIPLSFAASLFNISNSYGPGQPNFRIFWAVGLSLTAAVTLAAFLMYSGFNDEGYWLLSESILNVFSAFNFRWLGRFSKGWTKASKKLGTQRSQV